jgi:hypothetical protein
MIDYGHRDRHRRTDGHGHRHRRQRYLSALPRNDSSVTGSWHHSGRSQLSSTLGSWLCYGRYTDTQTLGIEGWQRSRGNYWMLNHKFHKSRGMPTDTTVVSSTSKPYSHVQETVIPGQCNSHVVADGRG